MSPAPKSKILIIIIGILLVANIILIALLVLKQNTKKGMRGDRFMMITLFLKNDMVFNNEQLHQYDSINTQHRIKMKTLFDGIQKEKEEQFKKLTEAQFSDIAINTTAELSSNKQKEVEFIMLHHFKDIRDLCTPQQLPKFDSLFYKVLDRRGGEMKK